MNELEKIGMGQLRQVIIEILEDVSEKNIDRWKHQQAHTEQKVMKAISIARAIDSNHQNQER